MVLYTGAYCYFTEYGCWAIGDLHKIEGAVFFNMNPASLTYDRPEFPVSHNISLGVDSYVSWSRGIALFDAMGLESAEPVSLEHA